MHSPPLSCKISNPAFEPSRVELMKVQFQCVIKVTQRASNLLQHPPNPPPPPPLPPSLPHIHIAFLFLIAVVRHRRSCSSTLLSPCSALVHIAGLPAQIHCRTSCCCHRRCHSCSPPPDPKASVIRPYLHCRPFSKLISLLMFIDAIPQQGGLISLASGVLLDEGGPQHEEHSG